LHGTFGHEKLTEHLPVMHMSICQPYSCTWSSRRSWWTRPSRHAFQLHTPAGVLMFCSPMKLHHCAWLPPWPKKQSMHALDAVDAVDAVHFSPTFEWSVVEVQSLIKASILRWSIKGVHTKHGNEDDEVDLKLTNWSAEWDSPLCTEAILSYMTRTWKEAWTKSNKIEKTWKDKIRIDSSCSCHVPVIIWQEGDLGRVSCLSDTDTVAMKEWSQGQSLEKTRVWHVTKYVWICIALSQLSQLSRDMSWSKVPAFVTYHSLGIPAAFSGDFGRSKCFLCAREDAKWSSSLDSYQDSQDSQDSIWFAYLGNDSKDSCLGSSFWQFLCHLDYMWTI
jgi:hypothetical protein